VLIKDVISKYSRFTRNLPRTMRQIHRASYEDFEHNLKRVALDALQANTDTEDREAVGLFVETFVASNAALAMSFMLRRPDGTSAMVTRELTSEDVAKWVREGFKNQSQDNRFGKIFDGRDQDVEKVVRKMQGILIYSKQADGSQSAARDKYLPLIREFLAMGVMTGPKIAQWSRIVLAAWLGYVSLVWPDIARSKIRAALRGG
jgi:hypothetical protein